MRKTPQRLCVGCQTMTSKKELIRVVRTPDGEVLVDATGKKSGRGVYICPRLTCLQAAVKSRRIEKALAIELPPALIETLIAQLEHAHDHRSQ